MHAGLYLVLCSLISQHLLLFLCHIQADEYAKGLIALGLKRGDTMTTFGVVSAETLYISVAGISLGIGYSVCTNFCHFY